MFPYFDKLLQFTLKYRKSVALSYFFFGAPITYFLREFVGLAPGSTAFTGAFTFGPLLLALPFFTPNRLFMPNIKGTVALGIYWFLTLFYLLVYAPHRGTFTNTPVEFIYFMATFSVFFISMSISINELKDNFVKVTLILCVISCFTLIFVILRDPTVLLTGRAGITMSSADGDESRKTSNPHLFAKAAYAGLICLFLVAKNYKSLLSKVILVGLGAYFIMVLGLTQSMQTILAFGIFVSVFMFFRLKPVNVYYAARWVFGIKGLILGLLIYFSLSHVINHTKYGPTIISGTTFVIDRVQKIYTTVSGKKVTKINEIDLSAGGRIETITNAFKVFEENLEEGNWVNIFFGNGYQHLYIDSPFIQSFNDLGLFGFSIFVMLHVVIISIMFKEFRNPTTEFNSFICYAAILVIMTQFVAGMPYDYNRYSLMAVMVRFCLPYAPQYVSSKLKLTT